MVTTFGRKRENFLSKFHQSFAWKILTATFLVAIIGGMGWFIYDQSLLSEKAMIAQVEDNRIVEEKLATVQAELDDLKKEDQLATNTNLKAEIANIERVYEEGAKLFEERSDLVILVGKVYTVDKELAKFLRLLGDKKWLDADVPLAGVRKHGHDRLASPQPLGDLQRRPTGGSCRDADEDALLGRKAPGGVIRLFV